MQGSPALHRDGQRLHQLPGALAWARSPRSRQGLSPFPTSGPLPRRTIGGSGPEASWGSAPAPPHCLTLTGVQGPACSRELSPEARGPTRTGRASACPGPALHFYSTPEIMQITALSVTASADFRRQRGKTQHDHRISVLAYKAVNFRSPHSLVSVIFMHRSLLFSRATT